jgi:N-acetylglucosamine-6-phosphate deacetylase
MHLVMPGLFDLQVNGFGGVDFNAHDLTADRVCAALDRMRRTGVTRCLPTLITSPFDRFAANARVLARCPHSMLAGIHMEGPYLSPADGARGAHPRKHIAAASREDFRRRQDAAEGRIVLVTLAPEIEGALALIEHLAGAGIRVAIGHTAAAPQQIEDGIRAGATLATHLGNGCAQMLPRHPNVIWELLAADDVSASFIVDGHHLPPATVKAMIRAKGAARTILVTDAMAAAGCKPPRAEHDARSATALAERQDGRSAKASSSAEATADKLAERRYTLGDVECELGDDGRVSLPGTPYLAGSSLTLDRAIANTVRYTGLAIDEAIPMASTIPAAYLGMTTAGTVTADWEPESHELHIREIAA